MKNVLKSLAKSVLLALGLITAASATDAGIHKKIIESGMIKLIISNEEMNDIMNIVKSLEEFGLLIKSFSKTIEKEVKERKGGFTMLVGTLGAIVLGNLLTSKDAVKAVEGLSKAEQNFKCCLIFQQILKYRSIIKINLTLMVFNQKILYLK